MSEQTPETTTIEPAGQIAGAVPENSTGENKPGQFATIRIEGQEFELEASLAGDDKLLKTVLQPHYSSVENAGITREVKDGKLHVAIVKKAQHKGA